MIDKDGFLVSLIEPLADSNDVLTDKEIEQLPLQLQYYEGCRETDATIICKLVETLYQVKIKKLLNCFFFANCLVMCYKNWP